MPVRILAATAAALLALAAPAVAAPPAAVSAHEWRVIKLRHHTGPYTTRTERVRWHTAPRYWTHHQLMVHEWRQRQAARRAAAMVARAIPPATFSSTVYANLLCIHKWEEPSWDTAYGGLGFIYPPTSYGGVAATLAQTYGDSWPGWPVSAQLEVGAMLVARYGGYYPTWSSAPKCGLQ